MPPDSPNPVERFTTEELLVQPVPTKRPDQGEWVCFEDYQAEVEKREEVEAEKKHIADEAIELSEKLEGLQRINELERRVRDV